MGQSLLLILATLVSSTVSDNSDITTVYRINNISPYSTADSTKDINRSCSDYNGGCQATCTPNGNTVRCSCPSGYLLNADEMTCKGSDNKRHVLLGSSGTLTSPKHPQQYSNSEFVSWLIVGPEDSKITLNFTAFITESCCDHVTVFDGENDSRSQLGRFSGSSIPKSLQASKNRMFVTFKTDGSGINTGFAAQFQVSGTSASEELHLGGNNLGILVQGPNGTYMEPDVSIPELKCIPFVTTCPWKRVGKWISDRQYMNGVLPSLRIIHSGQSCKTRHCQGGCTVNNGESMCTCPKGYVLTDDKMTCRGVDSRNQVLKGSSGSFKSPNHPYRYSDGDTASWLLIAPQQTLIHLNFSEFDIETGYDYLEVYDGTSPSDLLIGRYSGSAIPSSVTASGNRLYLRFKTDGSNSRSGFVANYTTSDTGMEVATTVTSSENRLESPLFLPSHPDLCVSIISKLSNINGGLWVFTNPPKRQKLNMTRTRVTQFGEWRIERFTASLAAEDIEHPLTVSIHVTGIGTSILSIMGCDPYVNEDVYTINSDISTNVIQKPSIYSQTDVTQSPQVCYHGGVKSTQHDECNCPNGFAGPNCQEGCGPNSYGKDCAGLCSAFDKGCSKMIFCKGGLPCLCAPGFEGVYCDVSCSSGRFGASCRRACGQCSSGQCDVFTGECEEGCKPGYFPPLCQDAYKKLARAPTVGAVDFNYTVITANLTATVGRGNAKFFVVQYKEADHNQWSQLLPIMADSEVGEAKITGLRAGIVHNARVVLIDEDNNGYELNDVPTVTWKTRCSVPTSSEYHITSSKITSGFEVSWNYNMLDSTWCSLMGFEIITYADHGDYFRSFVNATKTTFRISNLLPGRRYSVRVQAATERGMAPQSAPAFLITEGRAPGRVSKLNVTTGGRRQLHVTWQKPHFTGGSITSYQLEYKCLRIVGCKANCSTSSGQIEVTGLSAMLADLFPHAQYSIKVAGKGEILGPYKTVIAATNDEVPTVIPEASIRATTRVTNNSFVAHWNAPSNCSGLHGYLLGYSYDLVSDSGTVHTGITQNTHVHFTGLAANTQYHVFVRLFTSATNNRLSEEALTFLVKTTATVPESMRHLTVYKKGRHMIGVRWPAPAISHDKLKSFTVSYRKESTGSEVSQTVGLERCMAWPDLYCHTINGLTPDTHYVVSVRAESTGMDSGSTAVSVKAMTREGGPESPSHLELLNRTQSSLEVVWGLPNMINGVLRSFLLNVEETDSLNNSECCEYFPIQELPVRSEQMRYHHEMVGLRAASTFSISVTAKTVTMGPTVTLIAHTAPNAPVLAHPPALRSRSTADPVVVKLPQAQRHPGLRSTYLLLVLTDEKPEHLIRDQDLAEQLAAAVQQNFYIVQAFTEEDLAEEKVVTLGTGSTTISDSLGQLQNSVLTKGIYQLGLALILDYNGAKSVGFVSGESFTVA